MGCNFDQDFVLGEYMQHPPDKIPSMPILVFIDRRGYIRAKYEGADPFIESPNQEQNIRAEIQKLIAARVTSR